MLNRDGISLLRQLIDRMDGMRRHVQIGDCKSIAVELNYWMPDDVSLSAADVYAAIADHPEYPRINVNIEILRARIDAMPTLYSARLNSDHQTILNELNMVQELVGKVTADDVKAAMSLRAVPKPTIVVTSAAKLTGTARF